MADIEQLDTAQADPQPWHRCTCGRTWPSKLYAEDCADQDALEDEDRRNGHLFRSAD